MWSLITCHTRAEFNLHKYYFVVFQFNGYYSVMNKRRINTHTHTLYVCLSVCLSVTHFSRRWIRHLSMIRVTPKALCMFTKWQHNEQTGRDVGGGWWVVGGGVVVEVVAWVGFECYNNTQTNSVMRERKRFYKVRSVNNVPQILPVTCPQSVKNNNKQTKNLTELKKQNKTNKQTNKHTNNNKT